MLSAMNRSNCGSGNDKSANCVIVANGISTAEFLTGFYRSLRFKITGVFSILCLKARKSTEKASFNVAIGVLSQLQGEAK